MNLNGAGSRGLWQEACQCAAWLASPTAYGSLQIARQTGCGVLRGPFAGMRYPCSFVPRQLFPGPYLAGSFECELEPIVNEIIARQPEVLVNVGSAQGYYAVGLGRALWETSVIAYETDPVMRAAACRIARLNEVAPRFEARGVCTPTELAGLGERLDERSVCMLMDCEGGEVELIDPEAVPWLARASLLVELHGKDGGSGPLLQRRLAATHEQRIVREEPRWASRFPELWWVNGLREIDRELVVAEYRQGIQEWLWAVPKGEGA